MRSEPLNPGRKSIHRFVIAQLLLLGSHLPLCAEEIRNIALNAEFAALPTEESREFYTWFSRREKDDGFFLSGAAVNDSGDIRELNFSDCHQLTKEQVSAFSKLTKVKKIRHIRFDFLREDSLRLIAGMPSLQYIEVDSYDSPIAKELVLKIFEGKEIVFLFEKPNF